MPLYAQYPSQPSTSETDLKPCAKELKDLKVCLKNTLCNRFTSAVHQRTYYYNSKHFCVKHLWIGTKSWLEMGNILVLWIKRWTPSDENNRYTHSLLSWNYFHSSFHAETPFIQTKTYEYLTCFCYGFWSRGTILYMCTYYDNTSYFYKIISIGFVIFMKTPYLNWHRLYQILIFYS